MTKSFAKILLAKLFEKLNLPKFYSGEFCILCHLTNLLEIMNWSPPPSYIEPTHLKKKLPLSLPGYLLGL